MSEMEWEDAPEVTVPRVRNWLNPALRWWARFMYGRRGRQHSFFEWFFFWWLILFYQACKLMLYAGIGLLMMLAFAFWAVAELMTYGRRHKRAVLAQWGPFMGELYGEGPPHAA